MAEPPMLAVRGVATFYGAIQALHGVDLDVARGEIVTLIGANGAGKSTLLMTICGNPRARSGSITFDGEDITGLATHEIIRRGVAQVPEGRRIFPRMSVFENLQMGATLADPAHFQHDLERVFAMFPRGRAERLPRAPPGRPRLCAGQRPGSAERRRPGTFGQRRGTRRLSRGWPPMSPIDTFMVEWFGNTLFVVLLLNIVLVGPASFASGHAVALTWRPWWQIAFYTGLLSATLRFLDYALAGGELWSLGGFLLGWLIQLAVAAFAYQLTRARLMVQQYPWLYRRKGLLGWEERH